jgi:hypothetical protein
VIDVDHPDLSPQAAMALAGLRRDQGQSTEAYRLCRLVIDSGHPGHREAAHEMQSLLLHGELERASHVPGTAAAFNLIVHARGPGPDPCPAASCRPMAGPVEIGPAPPAPEPLRPGGEERKLIVITHGERRITVEFDFEVSGPARPPLVSALTRSLRAHLGAWRSPGIPELSSLRDQAVHGAGPHLLPALCVPWAAAHVRERLLGEVLAAAIAEEAVDLGTLRTLVSQLPAPDRALLCERGALGPTTKTISELMLERYFAAEVEAEAEELPPRVPEASRHVVFLDSVERLCHGSAAPCLPISFAPAWQGIELPTVSLPTEVTGCCGDADPCDPDADRHGLHR